MFRFKIKRLSDGKITHAPESADPDFQPMISKFHNLENNYEIIREDIRGEVVQRKRRAEYQLHDELRNEAVVEKLQGRDEKWLEYLAIREAIKVKYPKPL